MRIAIKIRPPHLSEAEAISALVCSVAHACLGQDASAFVSTLSPSTVEGNLQNPSYSFALGFVGDELAGVAAIREQKHVHHLFVAPKYHNQGIAKSLWHYLKKEAVAQGTHLFTVNSSLYAVLVYQKFGFLPISQQQLKNGIAYVPMQLMVDVG